MTHRSLTRRLLPVFLFVVMAVPASLVWAQQDAEKKADPQAQPNDPAAVDDAKTKDVPDANAEMYVVPDGTVAELMAYIKKIRAFQPTSVLEVFSHRKNAGEAIRSAAEKILAQEKDQETDAYKLATLLLLQVDVGSLPTATPEDQARVYQRVKDMIAREGLTEQMFGLAFQTASGLEHGNNRELAAQAFSEFGKQFGQSENEEVARVAEKLKGAARRLQLPGKPIKVEGTDLAGEKFDWKAYQGKVVLIDFWATWCFPCVANMPKIQALYEKFHDKGFDVVGINIDQDRVALEDFVKQNKIPWTTLHENDGTGEQPTADYYGVLSIPTMMLVGRDGNVISISVEAEELEQIIYEQFGEKFEPSAEPAEEMDTAGE